MASGAGSVLGIGRVPASREAEARTRLYLLGVHLGPLKLPSDRNTNARDPPSTGGWRLLDETDGSLALGRAVAPYLTHSGDSCPGLQFAQMNFKAS